MRKSKALQLFQDTTLRKEYVQPRPLMPFPDASQRPQCPTRAPQTSVKLGSSLWLCHLFFLSTFFLIFTPSPSFLHVSRLLLCINAGSAPEDKSRWIADGQCSETKRRCSTFTLLLFNCFFNSTEVNGSVCYTAPLLLYLV